MEDKPVMLRLLSHSIGIASKAGAEIRRICLSGKLGVVDKSQGLLDYQTEADRRAQRMIVANLSKRFPRCSIVGEEQLKEDAQADESLMLDDFAETLDIELPDELKSIQESDLTVWVDPMDGTTEFVKGLLEHVTVLIGISYKGRSIAGVVHQPFYGFGLARVKSQSDQQLGELNSRTMWGCVGVGCFGIEAKKPSGDGLIVTTTASHSNTNVEESIKSLNPDQVLKVGGAGHKALLVLEGKAHAFVFTTNGCKRWDTCAPEALLAAAGGRLTDSFGDQIVYIDNDPEGYNNYFGVVAALDESVHSKVIGSIPQSVKDRLIQGKMKSLVQLKTNL